MLARLSLLQQSSELPFAACISRQPLRLVWTPQDKPTAMDGLRPILLAQHVTAQLSLSCASPLSGHFGHGRDWSPTPIATVVGKSPSFQSSEKKQRPWQRRKLLQVLCKFAFQLQKWRTAFVYCRLESYLLFVEWFFSVYRRSKILLFYAFQVVVSIVFNFHPYSIWGEMIQFDSGLKPPIFFWLSSLRSSHGFLIQKTAQLDEASDWNDWNFDIPKHR